MQVLLHRADAAGRYPTPVDDIVAAAGLVESDQYVLDDTVIESAPAAMRDLLRSARDKILGLVDRRERVIHVSPTITNIGRRSFVKLHEVSHHVLPWQRDLLYADDAESLSTAVRVQFEREANHAAAALLFQGTRFDEDLRDLPVHLASIEMLARLYGASFRATARRFGERHEKPVLVAAFAPAEHEGDWERLEVSASTTWLRGPGMPRWPRLMNATKMPFLAALSDGEPCTYSWQSQQGRSTPVTVFAKPGRWTAYLVLTLSPV